MKPYRSLLFLFLAFLFTFTAVNRAGAVSEEWLLKFDQEVGVADYLYQRAEFDRFMNLNNPILNEALDETESKKEKMLTNPDNLKKVRKLLKKGKLKGEMLLLAKTWERILSQRAVTDKKTRKMLDKMHPVKSDIEKAFHSYKYEVPEIDKKKYEVKKDHYSRNEIGSILMRSKDWERNKALFLSAQEMGTHLVNRKIKPRELITMRNKLAKDKGYDDFIEMKYDYMFGKSTDEVFKKYFDPIIKSTEKDAKEAVESFKKRYGLKAFYPWHMNYARFGHNKMMDRFYPVKTLNRNVNRSFASIGFDLFDKKRYDYANDLFPRDNKYSHGACWLVLNSSTVMDDSGKETFVKGISRYAANFTKGGIDEYETAFHETGHAVHNMEVKQEYTGTANVNLLQDYFAPLMEGIAMTFEMLPSDLEWLLKYGKGKDSTIKATYKKWIKKSVPWRAFNMRRQLVFVYMERALYKKDPKEWTKTWWDYNSKFLFTDADKETNYTELPGWTKIPHYWGNNAGAYQQYIIAYMIRAQSYQTLKKKYKSMLKSKPWQDLAKAYIEPGNTGYWDKMIVDLTGKELSPDYIMAELKGKTL